MRDIRINNQKKNLAIFISGMFGGGAQRVVLNLAQGIANKGYRVDLVLARAEGPFLAEVPESVKIVNLNAPRVLASLPALAHYLQQAKPCAMLSAMNYVNITALLAHRVTGTPTRMVVSEHSVPSYSVNHTSDFKARLTLLLSHFYRWADEIIAVSQGVGDDLVQMTGISRQHIRVIYNPVVTPELRRKVQIPLDHPWFKPGCPPVLLAVGRLSKVKDFPTLIQAFTKIRRARPIRLIILGEGTERPVLEELAKRSGFEEDISLPGFVENPYAYMARASLYILSSKYEALPTVLIEALYCGVSIVATDCPGGTREILKNGQYGQLTPVGDITALVNAIETGLNNHKPLPPRESWLPFDIDSVVDQYLDCLLGSYS